MNDNRDVMSSFRGLSYEEFWHHVEEFAAAFVKYTNLPPDKIVMCQAIEYRDGNLINKIWFEEKRDT